MAARVAFGTGPAACVAAATLVASVLVAALRVVAPRGSLPGLVEAAVVAFVVFPFSFAIPALAGALAFALAIERRGTLSRLGLGAAFSGFAVLAGIVAWSVVGDRLDGSAVARLVASAAVLGVGAAAALVARRSA